MPYTSEVVLKWNDELDVRAKSTLSENFGFTLDKVGSTCRVIKGTRPGFVAFAGNDKEKAFNTDVKLIAEEISEPAIYRWYYENNELLEESRELNIIATATSTYKLEVEALADGFKDYDEIAITLRPSSIKLISPNPVTTQIQVDYELSDVQEARLIVSDLYGAAGTYQDFSLDITKSSHLINLASNSSGFYTLTLICDGNAIDSQTFIKY